MLYRDRAAAYIGCDYCSRASYRAPHDHVEKMLESLQRQGWRFLDEDGQPDTTCPTHSKELKRE